MGIIEIVEKVTQFCLPDLKYSLGKMFKVISECLGCEGRVCKLAGMCNLRHVERIRWKSLL